MSLPDKYLYTRYVTCFIDGEIPPGEIAVSSQEIMERIEPIFSGYAYSTSSALIDLRAKVAKYFYEQDPLRIIEKESIQQLDEYLPEADMIIWLFLNKKLDSESFWAIWEYQFADLNPFKNIENSDLMKLLDGVEEILNN